jgi:hypothetical protein
MNLVKTVDVRIVPAAQYVVCTVQVTRAHYAMKTSTRLHYRNGYCTRHTAHALEH